MSNNKRHYPCPHFSRRLTFVSHCTRTYSDVHKWWAKRNLVTFCKLCVLAAARGVGRGRFRRKGGQLLLPPHPPNALPRQCYEHTLGYKKVTRYCLAHHLWTSLYTCCWTSQLKSYFSVDLSCSILFVKKFEFPLSWHKYEKHWSFDLVIQKHSTQW